MSANHPWATFVWPVSEPGMTSLSDQLQQLQGIACFNAQAARPALELSVTAKNLGCAKAAGLVAGYAFCVC
jgi:hypothetical protein